MNCLDFRRLVGADPDTRDVAAMEHATACAACADFAQRTRELDRKILHALQLPVPETFRLRPVFDKSTPGDDEDEHRRPIRSGKHRWLALAASLLLGVGVAATMWLLFPRATLAADVVAHMPHEPQAWAVTDKAVAPEALKAVLDRSDVNADLSSVRVSYAQTCWFRGHFVPHLVVQDGQGPVTVMLLPHETVKGEERFFEAGYSGVILPAAQGSIAVLTQDPARIESAANIIRALNLLGN